MRTVVQAVILGLSAGAVYALMASGLTLAFGVMRVVNVAQGALVILGAYGSYALFSHLHADPFLSILLVTPLLFLVGVAVQMVFLRRLRSDERELSLLVTFAVAIGIEGVLTLTFKTNYRSINPSYANRTLHLLGYVGFGLGASTGAAAGAVYGIVFPFNPGSHYDLISRLLSIVVLGGLGSLGGAVVAALLMGVAEAVVAATLSPVWSAFAFFAVLIGVLLVRPQGLFGTVTRGEL